MGRGRTVNDAWTMREQLSRYVGSAEWQLLYRAASVRSLSQPCTDVKGGWVFGFGNPCYGAAPFRMRHANDGGTRVKTRSLVMLLAATMVFAPLNSAQAVIVKEATHCVPAT